MNTNPDEATTAIYKKEMINELEANMGNVTAAANKVGITARTHYRWLKEDYEYAEAAESMKDITYKKVKDSLIEKALSKIEKGDTAVLMKMLSIYLRKLPEDMEKAARINHVPMLRAQINYISTREEAEEEMRRNGGM